MNPNQAATFVFVHGAGDSASNWDLLAAELRERGRHIVAMDLPCEDESAGWWDYADTVVRAVRDRSGLVVVAHSLGGFTAPLVCARVQVDLLGLVADEIDGGHMPYVSRPKELADRLEAYRAG